MCITILKKALWCVVPIFSGNKDVDLQAWEVPASTVKLVAAKKMNKWRCILAQ